MLHFNTIVTRLVILPVTSPLLTLAGELETCHVVQHTTQQT